VSPSFAVRLTHLDANREVALLAFPIGNTDSIPWALGSIHADTSKQRAEFAIAVRSDHHDDGLGTALMKNLLKIAAERGIHEIWGDVLSDNSQMLELCRTLGFHRKRSPSDPSIIRVWFMLDQQPPGFNRS
jgi:acetyltransferase